MKLAVYTVAADCDSGIFCGAFASKKEAYEYALHNLAPLDYEDEKRVAAWLTAGEFDKVSDSTVPGSTVTAKNSRHS